VTRWLVAISFALASAAPHAYAQDDEDDDEIIIIDEDEDALADDDEILFIEDDDEGDEDPEPFVSPITGALGRLWEAWHVGLNSDASFQVQAVPPTDGPWRLSTGLALESWLLPAPNLSFYGSGFARLLVDGTPDGRVFGFWDVYEAYAKVSAPVGAVQLGRMVVPWGKLRGVALGDRLMPPDLRRGPNFPAAAAQRQPQWGGVVRTSLGAVSVEGVALVRYEASEGSVAASDQGGLRLGRYQDALIRSPARVGGLGATTSRANLLSSSDELLDSSSFGLRVRRRLGDFDLGGSVIVGVDETPTLTLRPEVARYLASEMLLEMGEAPTALEPFPCDRAVSLASCLGGPGSLRHERAVSFAADASWGLGIVILRAEMFAQPTFGGLPGKTTLLVDAPQGLHSVRIPHYAGALAVEGALGDWLNGSIEVFDTLWLSVPEGARLYGVELAEADATLERQVHRLGVGATLSGSLLSERISWTVRGEGGILQRDVLLSAQVRYRLPVLNLFVGGHGDAFAGLPGSPGWMRQDASSVGIFVGEGA